MKSIAIIGSGISGLTAAYLLSKKHKVTVFEKADRVGGHTATVDVQVAGQQYAIDTGFIVFNNKTYPNFLALLKEIDIDKQATEMSFSVHNSQTGLEYNGHNLNTLFAQRRNVFNVNFWRLIKDILRFNKQCKAVLAQAKLQSKYYQAGYSLGQFLNEHNFSRYFAEHYILPMGAAIWSCSLEQMQAFEYRFFVHFFNHHGLLNIKDRPQWYVIPNCSRQYLTPLCKPFVQNIVLNSDLIGVNRAKEKVILHFASGDEQVFDEVVLACHSDQAYALLNDATEDEQNILTAMPYSTNSVVLHTDERLLPNSRNAWASWNYKLATNDSNYSKQAASVTYNMNILQGIKSEHTFCVTLNQQQAVNPSKVLREFTYHHPIFSSQSLNAQQQRAKICGVNHTHFAGAYWHNGFHEDGVKSAIEVAKRFDCHLAFA